MNSLDDAGAARWLDRGFSLAIFGLAATFYGLTWRSSLYDDGEVFSHYFVASDSAVWYHVIYLPAARALHALIAPLGFGDHLAGLKALSVVSAAAGLAASWCAARSLGCARAPAALALLLLALSPCLWFFATTIELHATHFASVAIAAAGTLAARSLPFGAHLLSTAVLFPLLYLTHNSGALFGPGWIALFALARARAGDPVPLRKLFCVVGPALLAALLLTIAACNAWRGLGFGLGLGGTFEYIRAWHGDRALDGAFVQEEIWGASYCLLLVAALAVMLRRVPRWEGVTALLAATPVAAFWLWFAFPSRGGYFLGAAFFVFLLAARAPLPKQPATALLFAAVLVAAQGRAGKRELDEYEARFARADDGVERAQAIRTVFAPRLGARRAALLAFEPQARPIQTALPGFVEIPLHHRVPGYLGPPIDSRGFSAEILRQAEEYLQSGRWLVCYERPTRLLENAIDARVRELIAAFETELRARFAVSELAAGARSFWQLELRRVP